MYDSHKLPFFKSTKHETILLLLVSKKNTIQSQFEATIKKQNINKHYTYLFSDKGPPIYALA